MIHTVLFVSRNKDNKNLKGFKERRKTFLYEGEKILEVLNSFNSFVGKGLVGEVSRCYVSVNGRNMEKAKKQLICELVTNDDFPLEKIESKLVSIANKPENAGTNHWLFDFDNKDADLFYKFEKEVSQYSKVLATGKTPNGYYLVADHGFDTRALLKEYNFVELKRDDMLLLNWWVK